MKYIAAMLMVLLLAAPVWAEKMAVTEGGDKVLLKDDGHWELIAPQTTSAKGKPAAPKPLPAQSSPPVGQAPPPEESLWNNPMFIPMLSIGALMLVTVGGLLVYFFMITPAKKRKKMLLAFQIIQDGEEARYPEARDLLEQAILSGLKGGDVEQAHFGLAYVKAFLEDFPGAVADLQKADRGETEVLCLELWLRVQCEEYEEGYKLFSENRGKLLVMPGAKRLAGIACLERGMKHWREKRLEAAIHYFEELKELGEFTDYIPENISSYQVTLGVQSLFDKNPEQAQAHFNNAREQACKEGESDLEAQLGLALCNWQASRHPHLDEEVSSLARRTREETGGRVGGEKEAKPGSGTALAVNVTLWSAIARMHTWFELEENSGLPSQEEDVLRKRLGRVREIDPLRPDPGLILGLIDYFFHHETKRDQALEALRKSGSTVPEVQVLIKREERIKKAEKNSLERFFALLGKYLADTSVPAQVRNELKEKLERFEQFREMAQDMESAQEDKKWTVSLQDISSRGMILQKRIRRIVMPHLAKSDSNSGDKELFMELLAEIGDRSEAINQATHELESTEQKLMHNTAEFLFDEEPQAEPGAGETNYVEEVMPYRPEGE